MNFSFMTLNMQIAIGVLMFFFGIFGYARGLFLPLSALMALALAILIAPPLAKFLLDLAQQKTQFPLFHDPFFQSVGIFLVGTILYMWVVGTAAKVHHKHIARQSILRQTDRWVGDLLGALVGAVLAVSLFVLFSKIN